MSAELIKEGGSEAVEYLTDLFNNVAVTGRIPDQWMTTKIVPLYKGKGSRANVDNYRPIAIVPITYKIFTYVLLNRIRGQIEGQLLDEQRGFLPGRGTRDAIALLVRLEQECRRTGRRVYITFVDVVKAYDSVVRHLLFHVLREYGLEQEMVDMLQLLYTATKGQVVVDGVASRPFDITSGVKQGCILSPLLFNAYLDYVVRQCLDELREDGVDWEYPDDLLRGLGHTDTELDRMRRTQQKLQQQQEQRRLEQRQQLQQQQQRQRQQLWRENILWHQWWRQQVHWQQLWWQQQQWQRPQSPQQVYRVFWGQQIWLRQLQTLWWQQMWWQQQQHMRWQDVWSLQWRQLLQQQQEQQQQLQQRQQPDGEEPEPGAQPMGWYKKKLALAKYADDKALIGATEAGQQRQINTLEATMAPWDSRSRWPRPSPWCLDRARRRSGEPTCRWMGNS